MEGVPGVTVIDPRKKGSDPFFFHKIKRKKGSDPFFSILWLIRMS